MITISEIYLEKDSVNTHVNILGYQYTHSGEKQMLHTYIQYQVDYNSPADKDSWAKTFKVSSMGV